MHFENNDIISATSQHYIWHTVANKLDSLKYWHYSLAYKKSCSQLMIFVSFSIEKKNPLLLLRPLCPTQPPAHSLSLISIFLIPCPIQTPNKSPAPFPLLRSYQIISADPRLSVWTFRNMIRLYGEELLAPRPTPKLDDYPLSAVWDCLFNIFAAPLHIGGRFSIRNLRTRRALVTGQKYRALYIKS